MVPRLFWTILLSALLFAALLGVLAALGLAALPEIGGWVYD